MKTDMDYIAEQCAEIDRRQGATTTSSCMADSVVGLFDNDECNALMAALMRAAKEGMGDEGLVYEYLNATPKTTLIAEIVDALNMLGYRITPSASDARRIHLDNLDQPNK